ncbi:hypothetical protein L3Q82_003037 [Scortum barcoo]|uniref:Uncharacterized protein n=1 Tax=Scortum barcoo TaxID=214431 RepID=A0ACB8VRC2_9TELE|nr:hypothetical protein L3Q82_003037 [Scortum barcoo]
MESPSRSTIKYPSQGLQEGRPPGRHDQSRILDIERDQRAALTQRADRLFSSQRDRGHSVLERPGFFVQHDGLPSPQPPATPRGPISDLPPLNMKENKRGRVPRVEQLWDKEDLFFEKKLRVGSQLAVVACGMAKLTAKYRSPSPDSSVSSVDTHTPSELRAISQIGNFTPTPPSTPKSRRPTRLPVMSGRLCKSGKDGAGEYHLQSVKAKVEEIVDRLQQYQFVPRPSPRPPAAPRRTPAVAPKAPKPPATAAPPNKRGPRRGTNLCPQKADNKTG